MSMGEVWFDIIIGSPFHVNISQVTVIGTCTIIGTCNMKKFKSYDFNILVGVQRPPFQKKCSFSIQEQKILQLNQEINRLASVETEATRKDEMITQLKEEVSRARQSAGSSTDGALTRRVNQLQEEVDIKTAELNNLKDQVGYKYILINQISSGAILTLLLGQHCEEIHILIASTP
jgi:hypothetical protein